MEKAWLERAVCQPLCDLTKYNFFSFYGFTRWLGNYSQRTYLVQHVWNASQYILNRINRYGMFREVYVSRQDIFSAG